MEIKLRKSCCRDTMYIGPWPDNEFQGKERMNKQPQETIERCTNKIIKCMKGETTRVPKLQTGHCTQTPDPLNDLELFSVDIPLQNCHSICITFLIVMYINNFSFPFSFLNVAHVPRCLDQGLSCNSDISLCWSSVRAITRRGASFRLLGTL